MMALRAKLARAAAAAETDTRVAVLEMVARKTASTTTNRMKRQASGPMKRANISRKLRLDLRYGSEELELRLRELLCPERRDVDVDEPLAAPPGIALPTASVVVRRAGVSAALPALAPDGTEPACGSETDALWSSPRPMASSAAPAPLLGAGCTAAAVLGTVGR